MLKKAGEVGPFLERYDGRPPLVLLYGKDEGLIRERARRLVKDIAGGNDDPFGTVSLTTPMLIEDPGRLSDEARAIPLLGGRRAIHVRVEGRFPVRAVQPLLEDPPIDSCIVLEAGDLAGNAPLRTACEKSDHAVALPCFPLEQRDLRDLARQRLAAAGLQADSEALDVLAGTLGADYALTLSELDKLILYRTGTGRVSAEDVETIVADAGAATPTGAVDLAFAGRVAEIETETNRLFRENVAADAILRTAISHAMLLSRVIAASGEGGAGAALARERLHFRRLDIVRQQLRQWNATKLERAFTTLHEAGQQIRSGGNTLGSAALVRMLWSLALTANRRS